MKDALEARYDKAYRVVRKTIATANILRGIGLALAGLLVVSGSVELFDTGPSTMLAFPAIVGGAIVGLGGLAVHAALVALSQTAIAAIDTAVNTSPLLESAEKAAILRASITDG